MMYKFAKRLCVLVIVIIIAVTGIICWYWSPGYHEVGPFFRLEQNGNCFFLSGTTGGAIGEGTVDILISGNLAKQKLDINFSMPEYANSEPEKLMGSSIYKETGKIRRIVLMEAVESDIDSTYEVDLCRYQYDIFVSRMIPDYLIIRILDQDRTKIYAIVAESEEEASKIYQSFSAK